MLVHRGQDFLAGRQLDAAINQTQALGSAARQGNLAWRHLQVACRPLAYLSLVLPLRLGIPVDHQRRVTVETCTQGLDGFAYRPWMRGDQEVGEVRIVWVEFEQAAKIGPSLVAGARYRRGGLGNG